MRAGLQRRTATHQSLQGPQQQQRSALAGSQSQLSRPAPAQSHFSVPSLGAGAAAPSAQQPGKEQDEEQYGDQHQHGQLPPSPVLPQGASAAASTVSIQATSSSQAQWQTVDGHAAQQAARQAGQQRSQNQASPAWQDNRLWEGRGRPPLDWALHPTPAGAHTHATPGVAALPTSRGSRPL